MKNQVVDINALVDSVKIEGGIITGLGEDYLRKAGSDSRKSSGLPRLRPKPLTKGELEALQHPAMIL